MAAIVNERDKILQAALERIITIVIPGNQIPESLIGIKMNTDNAFFKTNAAGTVGDPTSLTFTITRTYLTAAATWSVVSGTATLTGTGDSRTLTFSNMSSDTATIRASVTQNSKTYTADVRVSKVKDGANGTNGTNGTNGANGSNGIRGTVQLYVLVANGPWSDTVANNAITSNTGSSTRYFGDTVTQYNNSNFAETRFWGAGNQWLTGQIIPGNVLVDGSLTSPKIGTNELLAVKIRTSGYVSTRIDDSTPNEIEYLANLKSSFYAYNAMSNNDAIGRFAGIGFGNACAGFAGISNSSATYDDPILGAPKNAGIIGIGGTGGFFKNYNIGSGFAIKAIANGNNTISIRTEAGGANSWALDVVGRFRWNGTTITVPPGGTTTFLRGDGTWAVPPGTSSSGVSSFNTRTGAVSLTTADVNAVGTISNNTSGSAADSAKLGGYSNTAYPRFTGNTSPSKTIAGYGEFNVNGTLVWLALYN